MQSLFKFLASKNGRIARVAAGVLLIIIGIFLPPAKVGWVIVIIGLVPLLAGILDKCVFAPLFGLPFDGKALRKALEK